MKIEETKLEGLFVITPEIQTDRRGAFFELFRSDAFAARGIGAQFVQVNQSISNAGVLRGLHFQWDPPLGKLIRVVAGAAFMAAADIRKQSPTLGQWVGLDISADNKKAFWVPPGFASGFCVLADFAEVEYCYTALYNPAGEGAVAWNDPALGIRWPVANPIVSDRDNQAPGLASWLASPDSDAFGRAEHRA